MKPSKKADLLPPIFSPNSNHRYSHQNVVSNFQPSNLDMSASPILGNHSFSLSQSQVLDNQGTTTGLLELQNNSAEKEEPNLLQVVTEEESVDFYQSVAFDKKLKEINEHYQAFDLLSRPRKQALFLI